PATSDRPAGGPVRRAETGAAPAPGEAARYRRWRLGDGRVAARPTDYPQPGGDYHPPRRGVRALPLGRREEHQPGDDLLARPGLEDPRVQGVRRAPAQGPGTGVRSPTGAATVRPPGGPAHESPNGVLHRSAPIPRRPSVRAL